MDGGSDANRGRILQGAFLMVGLIVGAWIFGVEIKSMKLADRYITVKGLVERTVKSDRATWSVSVKSASDNLAQCSSKSEADKAAVIKFFTDQGVTANELSVGQVDVTDKETSGYDANAPRGPRYLITQTVTVSSSDVDKIARTAEHTDRLVGPVWPSAEAVASCTSSPG